MSLEKELAGVIADGVDSPDNLTDEPNEESAQAQPEDGAGDMDSEGSDADGADKGTDGKPERPIENVRRELLRKQTESERRIMAQVSQLGDIIKTTLTAVGPGKKSAQSYDDLSVEELRAMQGQVPEDHKAAFESYLRDRELDTRITSKLTKLTEEERYGAERRRANKIAVERYPQLKDSFSELYREVNQRLVGLDDKYVRYNPRIVLNLADDVAGELGITPRHANRIRTVIQPESVRGTKPAQTKDRPMSTISSDEEFDKLAKRLGPAFKGTLNEEKKKRIKKRAEEYQQHFNSTKE